MRIVSLLPSTTEILFDLGAGDDVVGVTFECDYPAEARTRTIVSTSAMPEGLGTAEIDAWVADAMRRGEDLYHLDAGALSGLDADLVVTQDLCAVCAVDVSVVDDALAHLGCTAEVLTIDPHTMDEVLASIETLGKATGREESAATLVAALRARLDAVVHRVAGRPRPRTLLLEWTEPPFAPGHWVPEMVELAGGESVLGTPGEKSLRTTWQAVAEARPEVVVCAPCGYDLDGSTALATQLVASGVLPVGVPVWAVDANASFARPGPRLVDGVEALADILHEATDPASPLARRVRCLDGSVTSLGDRGAHDPGADDLVRVAIVESPDDPLRGQEPGVGLADRLVGAREVRRGHRDLDVGVLATEVVAGVRREAAPRRVATTGHVFALGAGLDGLAELAGLPGGGVTGAGGQLTEAVVAVLAGGTRGATVARLPLVNHC